jgi:metal-responsive CopG/Arc/MetJ family transcriptional regulator
MYNTGMKGTIAVDRTEKVGITLPKSILQRIDKVRGDIPRSTYIRRAVEVYLKQGKAR